MIKNQARSLKIAAALLATAAYLPAAFAQEPAPAREDRRLVRARTAVKTFADELKMRLVSAIRAGGPVAAIGVCRTVAPDIAAAQSAAHSLSIGRTALRVRNPANAPDTFERKVLEQFASEVAKGTDAAKLEHVETVMENGKPAFRYMKAIPMGAEPCLTCHGPAIKPDVAAEIKRLYPTDQATGFQPGELRGAFTVTLTTP